MKTIRQMQRDIRALVAERDAAVQRAEAAEADARGWISAADAAKSNYQGWMDRARNAEAALTEANARADAEWNNAIEVLAAKLSDMLRACAEANAKTNRQYAEEMREWADDVLAEASALRRDAGGQE